MGPKILAVKLCLFLVLSKTVICQNDSTTEGTSNSSSEESSSELPTTTPTTTTTTTTTSAIKLSEDDYENAFPEAPVCGVTNATFSRVVGGVEAKPGDFPWVALIGYNVSGGYQFLCGASLITSKHALSAAHCIYFRESSIYFVRVGEWDLADHNQTRPVDAVVKYAIAHENYSPTDSTNDIGILVFYRRVKFTDFVRPICMPVSCELRAKSFVDYRPFVAGWGRLKFQGSRPTRLQVLQLPVVDEETCRKPYKPLGIVIDKRVVCAGGKEGEDACNGDSGGPLMQPIWNSTTLQTFFYQTGVVSLGMKCGTASYPGVYTRVTEFLPWIQKIVLGTEATSCN